MKNLKLIIVFLLLITTFVSCSEDESITENKSVILKFETEVKNSGFLELDVNVVSYNPIKLESEFLKEVHTVDSKTGKEIYGYVLIQERSTEPVFGVGSIDEGYFFDGRCFVYGYLITYANGHTVFSACGFNCIGLDDVCPEEDEAFVNAD